MNELINEIIKIFRVRKKFKSEMIKKKYATMLNIKIITYQLSLSEQMQPKKKTIMTKLQQQYNE